MRSTSRPVRQGQRQPDRARLLRFRDELRLLGSDVTAGRTGAHVTFTYISGSQFKYALDGAKSAANNTVEIVCEGH